MDQATLTRAGRLHCEDWPDTVTSVAVLPAPSLQATQEDTRPLEGASDLIIGKGGGWGGES